MAVSRRCRYGWSAEPSGAFYRVRPARIPQHAGSLVAVTRWGAVYVLVRSCILPTGLMGIPERIRQRRPATGNREDVKKMAPVNLLTRAGMSRQQGSRTYDNHLAAAASVRRCWAASLALGLTPPANAAEETAHRICGADHRHLRPRSARTWSMAFQLYLDDVNSDFGGGESEVHRRRRTGQAGHRRHQGQENSSCRTRCTCWLAACWRRAATPRLAPVSTADKTVYVVPVSAARRT